MNYFAVLPIELKEQILRETLSDVPTMLERLSLASGKYNVNRDFQEVYHRIIPVRITLKDKHTLNAYKSYTDFNKRTFTKLKIDIFLKYVKAPSQDVLTILHNTISFNLDCPVYTLYKALSKYNHLIILKALKNTDEHDLYIANSAVKYGHIDVLKYINLTNIRESIPYILYNASIAGHMHIIEYLHEYIGARDLTTSASACAGAALAGNLPLLKWFRAHKYKWDYTTCTNAARGGHLDVLIWARKNRCKWTKDVCDIAAQAGHLDVLEWAHANGCYWGLDTCIAACWGGNLSILKYLHENKCRWNHKVIHTIASYGRLEILKYAHTHGCPWDDRATLYAAQSGHMHVLQYLIENGCPIHTDLCTWASHRNNLEMLIYAHTKGCTMTRIVKEYALKYNNAEMLEYFLKHA